MSSEWIETTIGEFASLQRGHDLPEQERRPGNVPILGSFGVTGYHDVAKAKGPGVTVGRSGASYGVVAYSTIDYWPLNTALYVTDFHGNNERFVYYFFKTFDFSGLNSGSAQPSLNRNYVHPIKIRIPQKREQDEIAAFLSALDDKIELNRRMNVTLEQMAQALFKSWFVDFDTVKAKAEGRAPEGMDADTAALFPVEFEESALGTIPKGWQIAELKDLLQHRNQRVKAGPQTESIPYVPIECITSKSVFLAEYRHGQEAQSSLTLFFEGDILFGAMRPYFHKVCLAPFDGVTRATAFVLKHRRQEDKAFSLFTVFQDSTIEYATLHSEGSTIPYAKWENSLERMKIVLPTPQVRAAFSEKIKGLIEKGTQSVRESKSLAELRDALLPRLISGQLRIPDIEQAEGGV